MAAPPHPTPNPPPPPPNPNTPPPQTRGWPLGPTSSPAHARGAVPPRRVLPA
jgi:hypothetical protein